MTYCAGLLLEQGLALASDTRTNAGVGQAATATKMQVFEFHAGRYRRISDSGTFYVKARLGWAEGLRSVFRALPSPDWC